MSTLESIAPAYPLGIVSADEYHRRMSTCKACNMFDGAVCSLCSCIMKKKAAYEQARCGEGKW
jgi:hypothetical protein